MNSPKRTTLLGPVVLGVLAAVVGLACAGGDDALTVGEVYDRMLAGMTEEGAVLYSSVTLEWVDVDGRVETSSGGAFWVDIERDESREEFALPDDDARTGVVLYVQGEVYALANGHAVRNPFTGSSTGTCAGSEREILYPYLGCRLLAALPDEEQNPRVEADSSFEGRDAIGVRFTVGSSAEGQIVDSVLYVDSETFLPIARVTSSEEGSGGIFSRYTHEFIPREELPDDWFDPGPDVREGPGSTTPR